MNYFAWEKYPIVSRLGDNIIHLKDELIAKQTSWTYSLRGGNDF